MLLCLLLVVEQVPVGRGGGIQFLVVQDLGVYVLVQVHDGFSFVSCLSYPWCGPSGVGLAPPPLSRSRLGPRRVTIKTRRRYPRPSTRCLCLLCCRRRDRGWRWWGLLQGPPPMSA